MVLHREPEAMLDGQPVKERLDQDTIQAGRRSVILGGHAGVLPTGSMKAALEARQGRRADASHLLNGTDAIAWKILT